ncbi:MAG: GIY-YIG nuclease family protein [Pedobacter sp.]|nr:GIY-YIG nuclease family protein [Pedobacter sp.]MDQ8052336.1 GIY-YIG nuclease family protein [Pedobacter sp.]
MHDHTYYVYILTNTVRTVLYIGVTNNLQRRLVEHQKNSVYWSFTRKYRCFFLVYYEIYKYVNDAIAREKELKRWSRAKKVALVELENKAWRFLNEEILED